MAAPKGNKFAGSRKGVPNKKTEQWETFAEYCLNGGLERFQKELNSLKGKQYVDAFTALLEYHKPKLARSDVNHSGKVDIIPPIIQIEPNDSNG
jgi:hypothetical protein